MHKRKASSSMGLTISGVIQTFCVIGLCIVAIPALVMSAYAVSKVNNPGVPSPNNSDTAVQTTSPCESAVSNKCGPGSPCVATLKPPGQGYCPSEQLFCDITSSVGTCEYDGYASQTCFKGHFPLNGCHIYTDPTNSRNQFVNCGTNIQLTCLGGDMVFTSRGADNICYQCSRNTPSNTCFGTKRFTGPCTSKIGSDHRNIVNCQNYMSSYAEIECFLFYQSPYLVTGAGFENKNCYSCD